MSSKTLAYKTMLKTLKRFTENVMDDEVALKIYSKLSKEELEFIAVLAINAYFDIEKEMRTEETQGYDINDEINKHLGLK